MLRRKEGAKQAGAERGGGGTRGASGVDASTIDVPSSPCYFRTNYDYQWGRGSDVQELTIALAARMRATQEQITEEKVDSEAISLVLLSMYRDWFKVHSSDLELQALLAVAAACRWLWVEGSDQMDDVLQMLDEVAEFIDFSPREGGPGPISSSDRPRIRPAFDKKFTENGLRASVEGALGASVTEVILTPNYFQISFVNGDYGEGAFDGALCMEMGIGRKETDDGLYLLDLSRRDRHSFKGANLPANDEEVEEALVGDFWRCKMGCRDERLLLPSQKMSLVNRPGGVGSSQGSSDSPESDFDDEEPINDIVSHTRRTGNILKREKATIPPPPPPPPPLQLSSRQRNDEFRDYLLRKCLQKDS